MYLFIHYYVNILFYYKTCTKIKIKYIIEEECLQCRKSKKTMVPDWGWGGMQEAAEHIVYMLRKS